jgi:threonine aldolase
LGHALASRAADFDLHDIAKNCDMFYIGGTKNGGLMGEAIVIVNPALQPDFAYHLRQRGALLSKTRSVSTQFAEFFRENLYIDNAAHANRLAEQLSAGLRQAGVQFLHPTATNQLFPILSDQLINQLKQNYGFHVWCKAAIPDHSVIRLVTSWSTPESAVHEFLHSFSSLK